MKTIEVRDVAALKEMAIVASEETSNSGAPTRVVWRSDTWFDAYSEGRLVKRVKVRGAFIEKE